MNPNDSTTRALVEALQELEDETVAEVEQHASMLTDCLSIPRGHDLAFAPSEASTEERGHLERCTWCQRMTAKIRAAEHPRVAALYAARWEHLPAADQAVVDAHVKTCRRCGLLMTVTGVFPDRWLELVWRSLAGAIDFAVAQPAPIGLNRTSGGRFGFREVITSGDWIVTVAEQGVDVRVVVNRRADGARHPLAHVIVIGADDSFTFTVPLTDAGEWCTGTMQVKNPWAERVEAVDLSFVVAEV